MDTETTPTVMAELLLDVVHVSEPPAQSVEEARDAMTVGSSRTLLAEGSVLRALLNSVFLSSMKASGLFRGRVFPQITNDKCQIIYDQSFSYRHL